MAQRLTDKVVRGLPAPATGNRITYDNTIRGFGCRVTAAGARAFIVNYRRKADGVERRITIGSYPDWSVEGAREKAKELKRHVDEGRDPLGEHAAERAAPTVADLCDRFIAEHVVKLSAHTRANHGATIRNDILPALGRMKVSAVEYEHIDRLHRKVSERAPVLANRMVAILGKMFTLAVKWKLRTDNPCKGIERNQEHPRQRYLKPEELRRLTKALAEDRNQQAADVFRLLLLTGARRGEILSAEWDSIDLAAGTWAKQASTTKQKQHHQVPLSAPARQILTRLREKNPTSPWVFPGRNGPLKGDIKRHWKRICTAAGIRALRVHDLRHSYASQLASAGVGLHVIGQLLGHSQVSTTHRYAHLFDDPLRAATERVGAVIAGKARAKVLPLARRRRR
jgi:integrase